MNSDQQSASGREESTRGGPLRGMRVLDLTDHRGDIGPWILGELGADVIKVEPPHGCTTRAALPIREGDDSDIRSLHFAAYSSNKRSITLDS